MVIDLWVLPGFLAQIELDKLDNLPQIKLPDETFAYGIKRFDRDGNQRIHMEDFAQVLVKYPHEKYNSANYEQIGRILYEFSGDGLADVQQFALKLWMPPPAQRAATSRTNPAFFHSPHSPSDTDL